ncbi:MAG: hypothetical protein DMG85_09995, partial [Acidobacteria bacterium]
TRVQLLRLAYVANQTHGISLEFRTGASLWRGLPGFRKLANSRGPQSSVSKAQQWGGGKLTTLKGPNRTAQRETTEPCSKPKSVSDFSVGVPNKVGIPRQLQVAIDFEF